MEYVIRGYEHGKRWVVFEVKNGIGVVVFHRETEDAKDQCINYKNKKEGKHVH